MMAVSGARIELVPPLNMNHGSMEASISLESHIPARIILHQTHYVILQEWVHRLDKESDFLTVDDL